MKMIVETKGDVCLLSLNPREFIPADRPAVVTGGVHLYDIKASRGELRIEKSDLPDTASDEEFAKCWDEFKELEYAKRKEAAIGSYLAILEVADIDEEAEKAAEAERLAKEKAEAEAEAAAEKVKADAAKAKAEAERLAKEKAEAAAKPKAAK